MTEPQSFGGQQLATRFDALDGLRGVAALCVVIYHRKAWLGLPLFGQAYLAVDFFFVLSGFVIAHAYGCRLADRSISLRMFAWLRAERLGPLLVAGTTLGLIYQTIAGYLEGSGAEIREAWAAYLPGLVLFPWPRDGHLFSLNNPAWSLFFEIAANFAFALAAPFLTTRRLIAALVVAAVISLGLAAYFGTIQFGYNQALFAPGTFRIAVPFMTGILIQRVYASGHLPQFNVPFWILAPLLFCVLALPSLSGPLALIQDVVCVFVIFPAIMVAGVSCKPDGHWRSLALLSAESSYPLYILHLPILGMLALVFGEYPAQTRWALLSQVLFVTGVAMLASRLFDIPVRSRLAVWRKGCRLAARLTTK